jgi:hypothetical protein
MSLLKRQWDGYPRYHQLRANLLWHLILVPMFVAGNILLVVALLRASILLGVAGVAAMIISISLQGTGHRKEQVPPEPFTSKGNAIARIFLEQWVTFPLFVWSGRWWRAFKTAR